MLCTAAIITGDDHSNAPADGFQIVTLPSAVAMASESPSALQLMATARELLVSVRSCSPVLGFRSSTNTEPADVVANVRPSGENDSKYQPARRPESRGDGAIQRSRSTPEGRSNNTASLGDS